MKYYMFIFKNVQFWDEIRLVCDLQRYGYETVFEIETQNICVMLLS